MEEIPVEEVPVPAEEPVPVEESAPAKEPVPEDESVPDTEEDSDFSGEVSDDEFGEPDFEAVPPVREKSVRELMEEVKGNPMVQEAIDLFGGKLTDVYENN